MPATWTTNQNPNETCPYKPQLSKMSNRRCMGASGFNRFSNKHSFLTRTTWSSQENTTGPKQSFWLAVSGAEVLSESRTNAEWGWGPPGGHLPTSLKPSQKAILTPWLAERGTSQAASTPQSGVRLPTCTQVIWITCNQSITKKDSYFKRQVSCL